ncbi:MAG: Gfo/Idh/MocA family oxidoreductase [Acidimicrobiia bacterium]|nr:Gfo/Idh/MocA family oxidoreductase [Acidimicrobiia bacterium]MDH4307589.1 Gfo/Idh/MocA family oxidoreductase [Acidimicrobiia bacterium]MDH5292814.1 Gfo/Idh/MocA family oxidoreductase [Acidimicrobiia bacterium]
MNAPLGWGIIGIGNIVESTIAPAMNAEPSCKLIAATSREAARAHDFCERFGASDAYTDYRAMLENPAVDAVFIATPNAHHADQVVLAAEHGKHVMCDKPLATTAEDAHRAVAACEQAGVFLGINFHNRYLRWPERVRELISSGEIGRVLSVQAEVGSGPRDYTNWRADPELAGMGAVFNVGVHIFDLIGWMIDSEPVAASAVTDRHPLDRTTLVTIRFGDGTLAQVNCNESVPHPRNDLILHGERGRIIAHNLTRARESGRLEVVTAAGTKVTEMPAPEAHRLCVRGFADAVLAGRRPEPSGRDGLRSMELCAAIDRSVRYAETAHVDQRYQEGP